MGRLIDMDTVNKLLSDAALSQTPTTPDAALKNIALALMHMAQAIERLQVDVAQLRR